MSKKLTADEREQVVSLAGQGKSVNDIAKELSLGVHRVAGVITMAKNRGRLAKNTTSESPKETFPMTQPTPTPQASFPTAAPVTPPPPSESFGFKASAVAGSFAPTAQSIKYMVERMAPPDGLLGTHSGGFTPDDLGKMYGEGTYKITKTVPGRMPEVAEQTVGASYGPPKYPKQPGTRAPYQAGQWNPQGQDPQSPYRPGMYPDYRDRLLSEFARHSNAPQQGGIGEAVAAEAIRQLGDLNRQTMSQADAARKSGPDTFMTQFFDRQQQEWQRQRAEERAREESQRAEERVREERRQKAEDEKWERRQDEEQRRHERDLERIRLDVESRAKIEGEQRKTLLELEQKKLDLIREEARSREQLLLKEVERSREESKMNREKIEKELIEVRRQSEEKIQAVQAVVEEEIERGRETLRREYEIRDKALDREHELKTQMLDMKEKLVSAVGGDGISKVMDGIVKQVGETIKEVVELKKLEIISPEAQVAAVTKATDGNVLAAPQERQGANGNGNGHSQYEAVAPQVVQEPPPVPAKIERPQGQSLLEGKIVEALRQPMFQEILEEWAGHVRENVTPATFAQTYLTWMQDPQDYQTVKGCTNFANFMASRNWKAMMKVIGPNIAQETREIFETEAADEFYTAFKTIVLEQMKAWAEAMLTERKAAREAQQEAQEAAGVEAQAPTA